MWRTLAWLDWKRAAQLESDQELWLLGLRYGPPLQKEAVSEDFLSRLWMTYRKDFPSISAVSRIYTTDAGWGCMLRSGQMMLAQAFLHHYLGRGWRRNKNHPLPVQYKQIVELFADSYNCPFSIHRIAQLGTIFNSCVGSWFSPNLISHVLKKCNNISHMSDDFAIYVSEHASIFLDEVDALCKLPGHSSHPHNTNGNTACSSGIVVEHEQQQDESGGWIRSLVLIVPVRVGPSKINPEYIPSLCKTFEFPQSVGIMGGKPNHSLYFLGYQGNHLLYLDPHTVQNAVEKFSDDSDFDSYNCESLRKIEAEKIDPSMALGFYFRNKLEFDDFCDRSNYYFEDIQPLYSLHESNNFDVTSKSHHKEESNLDSEDDIVVL